jgi:predicted transcriptional regulator of viral defense system
MYRDPKKALRSLYSLASGQGGYFTAKQAAKVGYGKQHVDYHVKAANFERVERGLYRLPTVPASEHDDLIRWSFWSRGRDDEPQAVVSHETALGLYDLGELLPSKLHFTVPPSFRKRAPKGCALHKGRLAPHEVEDRGGFRVTTPLRTLLDAAETVNSEQLGKAVREALDRGLVSRSKLMDAARKHPSGERLVGAMSQQE